MYKYLVLFVLVVFFFTGVQECKASSKDENMFMIAEGLYRDGFYDVAVAQLRKFLKHFPRNPKVRKAKFLVGEVFFAQKKYERAAKEYNSFILSYPESPICEKAWFRLGDCAYNTSDLVLAVENYQKVMSNFPSGKLTEEAYFWAGECFYQLKNYKDAISVFEEFLEKFPGSIFIPDALDRLGRADVSINDFPAVIKYLRRLWEEYPRNPLVKVNLPKLGDVYYKTGKYPEAADVFEAVIFEFPENENIAHITFYCGISFLKAEIYPCAIKYLEQSIPKLKEARRKLVKTRPALGSDFVKRSELEKQLERIQINIENAFSYCGNINFRLKKFNEALSSYQQLISGYPESRLLPGVLYNSGLSFIELDKSDEALLYFRDLIKRFPSNPFSTDAYLRLGVIYMQKQDYEFAIPMFRKALRSTDPEIKAEVKYYLGESYFKRNNLALALGSYKGVTRISQAKTSLVNMALYRIAEIYLKQEKIDKAEKIYRKLLETVKNSGLEKLVKMRIVDISDFRKKLLKNSAGRLEENPSQWGTERLQKSNE